MPATSRFVLHADIYGPDNQNLRIPGSAWTPSVQSQRGEAGPFGRLPNSQGDSEAYGIGGSVILGDRGYVGVSYSQFKTNYGTVAEPDVTIDLKQDAWNFAGELRDTIPGLKRAAGEVCLHRLPAHRVRRQRGRHGVQVERLQPARRGPARDGRPVHRRDRRSRSWTSSSRRSAPRRSCPTRRPTASPASSTRSCPYGPWKFSLGARVASVDVDAKEFVQAGLPADSRSFTPWSAGGRRVLRVQQGMGRRRERPVHPACADVPGALRRWAAHRHQSVRGRQPQSGQGESTSFDVTLKQQSEFFTSSVGAFYSNFSNFVGLFPTGIFRNPEDRSVAPDASRSSTRSPARRSFRSSSSTTRR